METKLFLGIDISKKVLDVALIQKEQAMATGQFTNDKRGFAALDKWVQKRTKQVVWCCLEATGRYGDGLALFLHQNQYPVSVVNPARIRRYSESKLRRNKSDQLDARLIADFCCTQKPDLWTPPPLEKRQLREMVRRLNGLIEERTRQKNRLHAGIDSDIVQASITAHIEFLNQQIILIEEQINAHIDQFPSLKKEHDLLHSIIGIGPKTAAYLLGELPDISRFKNADEAVAYAGLSVTHFQSGSSVRRKPKLSKVGNARLRTALYFPAISAIRYNPIIIALAQRLLVKGKTPMEIIGAAMRKLLRLVYGVLKTRKAFDPYFVVNLQNTA